MYSAVSGRVLESRHQLNISMAMTRPCLIRQWGGSLGDRSLWGNRRTKGPQNGEAFQWLWQYVQRLLSGDIYLFTWCYKAWRGDKMGFVYMWIVERRKGWGRERRKRKGEGGKEEGRWRPYKPYISYVIFQLLYSPLFKSGLLLAGTCLDA